MAVRTAGRMIAEELCAKYPDHANLGLAKRLRKEHPECFASVEVARTMVRSIRGVVGKANRKFATQPRKAGKAGMVPKMPPSLEQPWEPFVLDGSKRVGSISDTHIPYHSDIAFSAAG